MYYLGLTHLITKKCAILQPNYCVSISVYVCRFCVRGWRCIMYYHGRPIYTIFEYISRSLSIVFFCAFIYSRCHICPSTYQYQGSLLPIFYIMITQKTTLERMYLFVSPKCPRGASQLRISFWYTSILRRGYTISEYISRKMGASSNILYNNSEVTPV